MSNERDEFIKGLREVANFYEQNAEVPVPPSTMLNVYLWKDFFEKTKLLGKFEKDFSQSFAYATKRFSGDIRLMISTDRAKVCKRVVKEVIEVPETLVPAHVEEVVEWECDESWLSKEG